MYYFLDANNLAYACMYVSGLTEEDYDDKMKQGLFYSIFLNKIHKYIKAVNIKNIYLVWDTPTGTSWRKEIYPGYKQNRKKGKESFLLREFFKNLLPTLKEILEYYPLNNIEHSKAEADDIIYGLCEYYKNDEKTIISGDGDLKQLLLFFENEKITVYNPRSKKIEKKPGENFIKLKAIVGDISDNIKGLYRVGPKTAPKYLNGEKDFTDKQLEDYLKFMSIVDLRLFKYKDEIFGFIKEYVNNKKFYFDSNKIEYFMFENNMKTQLDYWPYNKENILKYM
jgi:DNA polymerase-1